MVTLSYFGRNIADLYLYCGDVNNPVQIFGDLTNLIYCEDTTVSGFVCYVMRDKMFIAEANKRFRIFCYNNGYKNEFRNIVLSMEKVE